MKRSGFLQAPIERARAQIETVRPQERTGFAEAARKETGVAQGQGHFAGRLGKRGKVIGAPGSIGEGKNGVRFTYNSIIRVIAPCTLPRSPTAGLDACFIAYRDRANPEGRREAPAFPA